MPHRVSHIFGEPLTLPMQVFNFGLPLISFVLTATGLEIDWRYVATVIGSTIAGSLLLGYYRREKTFGRTVYKSAMAMLAGLIFGSVLVKWRSLEAWEYIAATYCLCSMVVLFVLKAFVGYGERNAESLTRTVLQRIFNVPVKDCPEVHTTKGGSKRRRGPRGVGSGIHVSQAPDGLPAVIIDENARPDEVRVIENIPIETKKDGK